MLLEEFLRWGGIISYGILKWFIKWFEEDEEMMYLCKRV